MRQVLIFEKFRRAGYMPALVKIRSTCATQSCLTHCVQSGHIHTMLDILSIFANNKTIKYFVIYFNFYLFFYTFAYLLVYLLWLMKIN